MTTEHATKDLTQSIVDLRIERLRRTLKNGSTPVAFALAQKYASSGLAEAQYSLAQMLAAEQQPGDVEAAKRWYQAAARQGHLKACKALWRVGPVDQSLEFIIRAADLGDYQASALLILAYGHKADAPVPDMRAYLHRHVERGDAFAQLRLGYAYDYGYWGVPQNPEKAFENYMSAARQGDVHSMYCVGICLANGLGVPQNDEQAVQWYQAASRVGSAEAQNNLGYSYEIGRKPLQRSMREANRWYRRAALRDYPLAQYNLGFSYLTGRDLPQNVELANRWFARAAQLGNADAQVALGYSYQTGRAVAVSYARALELYKAAADSGNAQGQLNYALMLENGLAINKNPQEAARWYSAAAAQGLAVAQSNLALLYSEGLSLEKNLPEAARLWRSAAEQGFAIAQYNLARMYFDGNGMEKNPSEAFRLWRAAAEQGFAPAQCDLAWLYETGTGVKADVNEALRLYRLAADQGSDSGAKGAARAAESATARRDLDALENRLRAQDPLYAAKKARLIPILKPLLKHVSPSKWAAVIEDAYSSIRVPPRVANPSPAQAGSAATPSGGSEATPNADSKPLDWNTSMRVEKKCAPCQLNHMGEKRKVPNSFVAGTLQRIIAFGAWALLAWILTKWLPQLSYETAFGAVAAGAITIWTVGFSADTLYWALGGNSLQVAWALNFFTHNDFPTIRCYQHDDIENYLCRIQDDGRASPQTRMAAARLDENIRMHDMVGIFSTLRRRASLNRALDIYAPRKKAPAWRG